MRQCEKCRQEEGLDGLMENFNSWVIGNTGDAKFWGRMLRAKEAIRHNRKELESKTKELQDGLDWVNDCVRTSKLLAKGSVEKIRSLLVEITNVI